MTTSTSQINFSSINAAYPVAGADNDSQGFRDNFGLIKVALSTASHEITNLMMYSAKVSTEDGNGADNDFSGGSIQNAVLQNNFVRKFPSTTGPYAIPKNLSSFSVEGTYNFHAYTLSTNTSFSIVWPDVGGYPAGDGNLAKLRMQVGYDNDSSGSRGSGLSDCTISIVGSNVDGVIQTDGDNLTLPLALTSNTTTYVMDLWTYDAGATTFVQLIGKFTKDLST